VAPRALEFCAFRQAGRCLRADMKTLYLRVAGVVVMFGEGHLDK
jgi:hypothetical protein